MSQSVLRPDGGVVKTEEKAYPWHGGGSATYLGGADGYQGAYGTGAPGSGARAGGRVGVADWESVSVVSDLDKSLAQDASKMGGLNDKLAKYVKFTASLEQNNKDLHEQLMAARAELQRLRADLETRPTSQRYDSLIGERDELNKRLRDLMAQLQELRAEQKAWGRDANRVSLLEQELDMLKDQMRENDDEKAGNRDEVEGLERALAAAMDGQKDAEDKLRAAGIDPNDPRFGPGGPWDLSKFRNGPGGGGAGGGGASGGESPLTARQKKPRVAPAYDLSGVSTRPSQHGTLT